MSDHHYPDQEPLTTGLKSRCPRCGEGALFSGILTVKAECTACHLSFDFEDSGDGPTVFIMMGLGLLVLGAALYLEFNHQPPVWLHIVLWPLVILGLGIPALRVVKGVLIALQFKHDAAQGRIVDDG